MGCADKSGIRYVEYPSDELLTIYVINDNCHSQKSCKVSSDFDKNNFPLGQ